MDWTLTHMILIRIRPSLHTPYTNKRTVFVVIVVPVQSAPITTSVVSSNHAHSEAYWIQHYVIMLVSDFQPVVFSPFPPPIKLIVRIWLKYCWKWRWTPSPKMECTENIDLVFLNMIIYYFRFKKINSVLTKMFIHNFRSSQSYSHRGEDRWIYLCMKMTKVSDNLYYIYLLAGKLYFMN